MNDLNIYTYENYYDYLRDFFQFHGKKKGFSKHAFSVRIEWPLSLVNDLLARRRKLTVNRALEFCAHIELDKHATDYFIVLILKESDKEHVKEHFSNKMMEMKKKYSI